MFNNVTMTLSCDLCHVFFFCPELDMVSVHVARARALLAHPTALANAPQTRTFNVFEFNVIQTRLRASLPKTSNTQPRRALDAPSTRPQTCLRACL
jgi:hypothetical protein